MIVFVIEFVIAFVIVFVIVFVFMFVFMFVIVFVIIFVIFMIVFMIMLVIECLWNLIWKRLAPTCGSPVPSCPETEKYKKFVCFFYKFLQGGIYRQSPRQVLNIYIYGFVNWLAHSLTDDNTFFSI